MSPVYDKILVGVDFSGPSGPSVAAARDLALPSGGEVAGQIPGAMPRTLCAVDQVCHARIAPDARRKACDLLAALAAVERSFAGEGPAGVPAGLLREVVVVTSKLVGRTWLRNAPDRSADFTALYVTRTPPPLAELDQIIASVLLIRFGLSPAAVAA